MENNEQRKMECIKWLLDHDCYRLIPSGQGRDFLDGIKVENYGGKDIYIQILEADGQEINEKNLSKEDEGISEDGPEDGFN